MTIANSSSRPRLRAALFSVSAIALALSAAPAFAQEAVGEVDELVVTAEKREMSVKDVPSSVSVIGGQRLERSSARQIADFAGYVPGLTATSTAPGQNHLIIRGLTTGSTSSATVGVYVDDTPYGTARGQGRFALDLMPYDIERVEILRGPQGTLYGASTLGGLLKYVTRAPDTEDHELRLGAEFNTVEHGDNGNAFRVGGNAAIIEGKLAVRGSYYTQENGGYIDAVGREENANADTQEGGRLAVLFRPTEALTIRLTGAFQNLESNDGAIINVGAAPAGSHSAESRDPVYGEYAHRNLIPASFEQEVEIYSANVSWDLGFGTLTVDSSLSKSASATDTDNTVIYRPYFGPNVSTIINVDQESEKRTQEVRLASASGGKFEWLVGAYYTEEENENHQLLTALTNAGAPLPAPSPLSGVGRLATVDAPSSYKETALFGDVTVRFTDQFDITGGLRMARNEQKSLQASRGLLFGPVPVLGRGASKEDVVTYAISPRFKVNEDIMVYARLASGYRPGGPNVIFPGQTLPASYKSDSVVNYEAGVKGYWFDRKLSVDASVYYIDWKDIQIVQVFGGVQGLGNGKEASSKGFEVQGAYSLLPGLTLGATLAYTDAQLTANAPEINGKEGDRVPFVPLWSGSLTADYSVAAFGDFQWRIGGGYRYKGESTGSFKSAADYIQYDGYGLIDGYIGIENGRWSARVFGRNLADERVYVGAALPGQLVINQPRVLGISLNANF